MDYETMTVELNPEDPPRTGIDWQKVDVEPVEPPRSPRMPRDTEPCHLWVFVGIVVVLAVGVAAMGAGAVHAARVAVDAAMAYADAFLPVLVQWIGEVIGRVLA